MTERTKGPFIYVSCPECDGAQYVEAYNPDLSATPKMIECARCNGFGEIEQESEEL